jgi:hypothetical protein
MKRTRTVRRYLAAMAGLVIGLIASGVAYGVYLAPKQERAHALQQRVAALEAEKRALQAKLIPPDAPARHPHRHKPAADHEDEHRESKGRALRILGADQTLGIKAMQLRTLEALADAAEETNVEEFSYRDFAETTGSFEQVAVVTRHPEGGARHEQAVNRYTLRVEAVADYPALVAFLDRVNSLPYATIPREIRVSRSGGGLTKADLVLSAYFLVDR